VLTHLVLFNSIDGGDGGRFPRQFCKYNALVIKTRETREGWPCQGPYIYIDP
jgi:hypothetical protein